jgi:hypothetical protein
MMARFEITGFNETLFAMETIAKIPDSVMRNMMEAVADIVLEAQKRTASTMLQGPYYKGGVVGGLDKGRFERTADGAEHYVMFKGTQHGTRIAEIAFINEYGKKNQPARPFIKTANEQAAGEATEAAAKILHDWQDSQ